MVSFSFFLTTEFSFKAMFLYLPIFSAPGSTGHLSGQYWTGAKFTAHGLPSLTHCLGLLASPFPTGNKASQEQDEAQGTEAVMKWVLSKMASRRGENPVTAGHYPM